MSPDRAAQRPLRQFRRQASPLKASPLPRPKMRATPLMTVVTAFAQRRLDDAEEVKTTAAAGCRPPVSGSDQAATRTRVDSAAPMARPVVAR
jgi:hypothetical protein